MMYCGIWAEDDKGRYLDFIRSYLRGFPLPKEEFKHLKIFLKIRFMMQGLYHEKRYREGNIQGVSSQKDNLKGIKDGEELLQYLETIPPDYYHNSLNEKIHL